MISLVNQVQELLLYKLRIKGKGVDLKQLSIDCASCREEPLVSQVCRPGRYPRKTVTVTSWFPCLGKCHTSQQSSVREEGLSQLSTPFPACMLDLRANGFQEEEKIFTKQSMDKVQNSYLHSLQEVGDLLRKKLETIKKLKL
ncbi:hypothetical protein AB205_0204150 [Aquarana catesbeiana]|uniref:Uncharacterized protein n=1 Tax=Aquarana catesbeiana TaxID=8400 RepID=A0A2G9RZ12_AQUCT|nr:hypothetical protein AB205_0204150 [Aquarana catesbeiana]